jgi:hypothetical protein
MTEFGLMLYENELFDVVEDGSELVEIINLTVFSVDVENTIVVVNLVQVQLLAQLF